MAGCDACGMYDDLSIFGYKAFIVRSDSMSKTDFETGDLILSKEVVPRFITYGRTNDVHDEKIVAYNFVLGKYTARFTGVGKFFQFLKTTPGYIVCIFLPFLLLLLMQGINSVRLFRKCKKEQQEEKDQLATERAETKRIMAELLQMKEQFEKGSEKPEDEQPSENN